MSLSFDFMVSLFLLFFLIVVLYSLLIESNNSAYIPSLNYIILKNRAHYNSLYATLNSYSLKNGINNDYEVDCIISNKVYCKNNELNLTSEAPVYLRRGGGN
jgi:uncharacterized membrane protein YciS (DUF1049 family)